MLKGLAEPEGLLNLSSCGGAVQWQLPDAPGSSKAWPPAPKCCAGPHMPAGYEFRARELPGQLGPLSRYELVKDDDSLTSNRKHEQGLAQRQVLVHAIHYISALCTAATVLGTKSYFTSMQVVWSSPAFCQKIHKQLSSSRLAMMGY